MKPAGRARECTGMVEGHLEPRGESGQFAGLASGSPRHRPREPVAPSSLRTDPTAVRQSGEGYPWAAPGQTRYRVRCPPFATDLGAPQRMAVCANSGREQMQQIAGYSITSSTRISIDIGISMPSVFAVFRFMSNSTFVTCSTGSSAVFSPLRIRPA
jgi:hypothetical protein